jgi:S-adenosylmethionine/arginine decarboxylase-like enzyme
MAWGYHIMLDCGGCNLKHITNKNHIWSFLMALTKRVGMKAHGKAIIENLLEGTDNEGYSVLQMITTSNITCHFVNKTQTAYIDLFSCKEFEAEIVIATVKEFFQPTTMKLNFIERDA